MLENNNLKKLPFKVSPFWLLNQSNIFNETKHIVDFETNVEWQIIKQKAFIYSNFTLFLPFVLYNRAEYI